MDKEVEKSLRKILDEVPNQGIAIDVIANLTVAQLHNVKLTANEIATGMNFSERTARRYLNFMNRIASNILLKEESGSCCKYSLSKDVPSIEEIRGLLKQYYQV